MNLTNQKLLALGAAVAGAGFVLSGPAGFLLVRLLQPQPAWESPAVFAANYHPVQDVPYLFGLLLVGGMIMLAAGHYRAAAQENDEDRFHLLVALAWTAVFAALIFFNYICQTTFVRHLALAYTPANDAALSIFSMANPRSLCWSIEMWGYGVLGVATWLLAGFYRRRSPAIRWLLIGNGVMSVLGVVFTIIDINWVLTGAGLAAYFAWNVLMIALMALLYRYHSRTEVLAPVYH